jgi:CBS-domain-containing membrane protein
MTTEPAPLKAADLMNGHVKTLTEDLTLDQAMEFLLRHEVSCAPVVKEEAGARRLIVGILTEKDCLTRIADEWYFGSPRPIQTVATTMQRHPLCVTPEMDVFSLVSFFASHGLRHAPVATESGELLGIISRRDILRAIHRYYDQDQRSWQLTHFRPDLSHLVNLRFFQK